MTAFASDPFKPGETIEFCGDRYTVLANQGNSGTVKESGLNGATIHPFYWSFDGEACRRVSAEQPAAMKGLGH